MRRIREGLKGLTSHRHAGVEQLDMGGESELAIEGDAEESRSQLVSQLLSSEGDCWGDLLARLLRIQREVRDRVLVDAGDYLPSLRPVVDCIEDWLKLGRAVLE